MWLGARQHNQPPIVPLHTPTYPLTPYLLIYWSHRNWRETFLAITMMTNECQIKLINWLLKKWGRLKDKLFKQNQQWYPFLFYNIFAGAQLREGSTTKNWKFFMTYAIGRWTPSNGIFSIQFLPHYFLLQWNFTYMKRILHLVSVVAIAPAEDWKLLLSVLDWTGLRF